MLIKMKYGIPRPKWFLGQWLQTFVWCVSYVSQLWFDFKNIGMLGNNGGPRPQKSPRKTNCAEGWSPASYGWSTWSWVEPVYVGISRTIQQQFHYLSIIVLSVCCVKACYKGTRSRRQHNQKKAVNKEICIWFSQMGKIRESIMQFKVSQLTILS